MTYTCSIPGIYRMSTRNTRNTTCNTVLNTT